MPDEAWMGMFIETGCLQDCESTAFKRFCVFIVITVLISISVASFISLHIITIRRIIKKAKINTESNKN